MLGRGSIERATSLKCVRGVKLSALGWLVPQWEPVREREQPRGRKLDKGLGSDHGTAAGMVEVESVVQVPAEHNPKTGSRSGNYAGNAATGPSD